MPIKTKHNFFFFIFLFWNPFFFIFFFTQNLVGSILSHTVFFFFTMLLKNVLVDHMVVLLNGHLWTTVRVEMLYKCCHLRHFPASVNPALLPLTHVHCVFSPSVCGLYLHAHTHTHISWDHVEVFSLATKRSLFLRVDTEANPDRHGFLSVRKKKRQSIHPIDKSLQNKSNFTHSSLFLFALRLSVWMLQCVQSRSSTFSYRINVFDSVSGGCTGNKISSKSFDFCFFCFSPGPKKWKVSDQPKTYLVDCSMMV